jgi:hypothetical protein
VARRAGSGSDTQEQFLLGPIHRPVGGKQSIAGHAIDLLPSHDRFDNLWAQPSDT